MKLKSLLIVTLMSLGWHAQAQCDLTDPNLFLGDYYVIQTAPGLLGFNAFNIEGEAELITIESSGADNWREFSAVYLPEAGVGQPPRTFPIEFRPDCGVTLREDTSTGLSCSGSIVVGAASGGSFDTSDDSEFVMVILENIQSDCGESPSVIELTFTRQNPLSVDDNKVRPFSYAVTANRQLMVESLQVPLASLSIFSITGQVMLSETPGSSSYQKDLSALPTGIYFVRAKTAEGFEQTFKIIL